MQSWVGGFSGKNASNSLHTQHCITKTNDNSRSQQKNNLSRSGENFSQNPASGSAASSLAESNEKEANCVSTGVVRHNAESQNSTALITMDSQGKHEEVRKLQQTDKPDLAQKKRWGDLEEGGLALPLENLIGVGIKFGSIGDDNLLSCRKNGNIPEPCDSYHAQEKDLMASAINTETASDQIPLVRHEVEILGENGQDVKNVSLEHLNNQQMVVESIGPEDDILYCNKNNDEVNKTTTDSAINNDILSTKDPAEFTNEAHASSISLVRDNTISEVPEQNGGLSEAVTAHGNESQVPEIVNDSVVSTEVVRVSQDGNVENAVSTSQNMGSLEEGDSNESKERFRQRLWCFLFENLNRSVDELYLLCELECDLEQMKEAILVLEESASDFRELITRVEEFEMVKKSSQIMDGVPAILKSDHRRPHALSWEVSVFTYCCYLSSSLVRLIFCGSKILIHKLYMLFMTTMDSLSKKIKFIH